MSRQKTQISCAGMLPRCLVHLSVLCAGFGLIFSTVSLAVFFEQQMRQYLKFGFSVAPWEPVIFIHEQRLHLLIPLCIIQVLASIYLLTSGVFPVFGTRWLFSLVVGIIGFFCAAVYLSPIVGLI